MWYFLFDHGTYANAIIVINMTIKYRAKNGYGKYFYIYYKLQSLVGRAYLLFIRIYIYIFIQCNVMQA